jgi:hypothetical protein
MRGSSFMSRLWDTPDFWIRTEADEVLRDCPTLTADALAERLERRRSQRYGDPKFVEDIIIELRKRAYARVRFWPKSKSLTCSESEAHAPVDAAREDTRRTSEHISREFELADSSTYWWQRM